MAIDKFPEEERTFETRVKFIKELFSNKFENYQIMANCIEHKLDRSYESYIKDIHKSSWQLENKDPIEVLKRIDR
ncbi:MAG: hypothetical protein J6Z11_04915 [Candidatus Riflebacteria bacterium]|nr:hypothetical protein [Candidatus Riflebacteria bacterium]